MVASGVLENIVEKMIANNFDTGLEAATTTALITEKLYNTFQ